MFKETFDNILIIGCNKQVFTNLSVAILKHKIGLAGDTLLYNGAAEVKD